MKELMFIIGCIGALTLVGCKEKTTTEKEEIPTATNSIQKSSEKLKSFYVPKHQKTERVDDYSRYPKKYKLHPDENNYKIDDDNIRVTIPVSDGKMKIMNVFNVSDYSNNKKFNAIVIHLSNGSNSGTSDTVTHKIISDLKISKITSLSASHLKEGKLKVYLINEDFLDADEINAFIKCASQEIGYTENTCDLNTGKPQKTIILPREQEGDIITGG